MSEEKKNVNAEAPVPGTPKDLPEKTRKPRAKTTKPKVNRMAELEAKLEQAGKIITDLRDQNAHLENHIHVLEQRYTAITNHIAQNIDLCRANILVAIKEG